MPKDETPAINAYEEIGGVSLKRWGGYITEEPLPELQGTRGIKIYREMSDNDPVIGAMLLGVSQMIRRANWDLEGDTESREAQFVKECMDDMAETWEEFISNVCSEFVYGWQISEMVFKRRQGMEPGEADGRPLPKSKYNDGLIAWHKFSPRAQSSLHRWDYDEFGELIAMVQRPYPDMIERTIPIAKCLHFKTDSAQGNPEGRSLLRHIYRPWYFKKNFEVIMGIGVERDMAGFPVLYVPSNDPIWDPKHPDHAAAKTKWENVVKKMRRDENDGLLLPSVPEAPNMRAAQWKLELLSTNSRRPVDIKEILTYYDTRIAMGLLMQFLVMGIDKVGSYSTAVAGQDLFQMALTGWLEYICAELNRKAVPMLFKLNGWPLEKMPRIKALPSEGTDMGVFAEAINKLVGSKIITVDPNLENVVRAKIKLPELSEEDRAAILEEEERKAMEEEERLRARFAPQSQQNPQNQQPGQNQGGLLDETNAAVEKLIKALREADNAE